MKIILTATELKFDENYCNVTTNHENRPGEIYSLSFRMETLVEVKTFYVKVGIALPTSGGKYESFIQNNVADMCKYLKKTDSNLMLRLFFNGDFGSKKFPTKCPVKADVYYIEKFRIKENMLTIRAVESKILITVDFCTDLASGKMHCFFNTKFYAEVRDRKKWQQELDMKLHRVDG